MDRRWCDGCRELHAVTFFARKRAGGDALPPRSRREPKCRACAQERSDAIKQVNRFRIKATSTLRAHARSLGLSVDELRNEFRWSVDQIAHDAERAWGNGCPDCRKPFTVIASGLGDLTLDVIDPQGKPYYGLNTRWICMTCNRHKHTTSKDQYGSDLVEWQRHEARRTELERFPDIDTIWSHVLVGVLVAAALIVLRP